MKFSRRWLSVTALILMGLYWCSSADFICRADDELTLTEAYFAGQESVSGWINVPGRGEMRYYAQNDSLWGDLLYENKTSSMNRPFRDSGCSPTAVAMAVVQLVPKEELSKIAQYAQEPYGLCTCSLNAVRCKYRHLRYYLTTDSDYERFLPLILGDFATGNNTLGASSRNSNTGTGSGYIHHLSAIYGLTITFSQDYDEAITALKDGKAVVSLASKGAAFTNTGHYVLLAGIDEDNLYVLDPLCRTEYKTKHADIINILQPGFVSIALENVLFARFNSYIIFSKES